MHIFTDSSRPALYRSPTEGSLILHVYAGIALSELYALHTIVLRVLYDFLDVIAFAPEANEVGNNSSADFRSSVPRDATNFKSAGDRA
jgi:hypothetical protein